MRSYTKADKERGVKLRDLGCIVCLLEGLGETPPAIHHIDGKTKPGCHQKTLGLCKNHHQIKDNEKPQRWISRHGDGRHAFEEAYGDEYWLLEQTNQLIGYG